MVDAVETEEAGAVTPTSTNDYQLVTEIIARADEEGQRGVEAFSRAIRRRRHLDDVRLSLSAEIGEDGAEASPGYVRRWRRTYDRQRWMAS
jgi:hypothetical protein